MNLVLKLLASPWFWLDIFLSVSGGIIVWWGLRVEKRAERLLPPDEFKPDLFDDIVKKQKREVERGWRILMTGIVFEVVAALGISVISGLEIASLNDKAEQAGKDAAAAKLEAGQANERAAMVESNNVALEAQIQPRRIPPEQKEAIRRDLREWRFIREKCEVHITVEGYDTEARIFADQIGNLLGENFRVFTEEGINATPPAGFGTKFSTHDPASPSARSIARALARLPIKPITVEMSTNIPEGTLNIEVWPKPLE
jgi:hypothetical protein